MFEYLKESYSNKRRIKKTASVLFGISCLFLLAMMVLFAVSYGIQGVAYRYPRAVLWLNISAIISGIVGTFLSFLCSLCHIRCAFFLSKKKTNPESLLPQVHPTHRAHSSAWNLYINKLCIWKFCSQPLIVFIAIIIIPKCIEHEAPYIWTGNQLRQQSWPGNRFRYYVLGIIHLQYSTMNVLFKGNFVNSSVQSS